MFAAEDLDTWTITTEVFEGPLDLLLYLVRRDGVDVSRLQISRICDAYLVYLERLREMRLNVAADYLVMAATLCHLKSLALLPRAPAATTDDGEEGPDPTETLARQLEQYQKIKERAAWLDAQPVLGRDTFGAGAPELDDDQRPITAGIDAFGLLDLYWELLAKAAAGPPTHILPADGPDLRRCCEVVLEALDAAGGRGDLGAILVRLERAAERVVAFVAALEMVRLQWLDISQAHHLAQVVIWVRDRAAIDLTFLTGALVGSPVDRPTTGGG
jgi:segregation and condensation protein A